MNQYTELVEDYMRETGTDPFVEYKSASDERKAELEEWLFQLFRSKNEIPVQQFTDSYIQDRIVSFSSINSNEVYNGGEYGYNISCINIINTFFPEMFDVWKGKGMDHPSIRYRFYNDYFLHRGCKKVLTYGKSVDDFIGWVILSGAGYCSNFRPAVAKAIYELFGTKEDCRVFDSSAGYGARLFGANFATNVSEYVGIDPNTKESCDNLISFLDNNFPTNTKKTVLKMGSEDFTKDKFPQYREYFDLYFTSPPYFDTERYSDDETQSYVKFPTYAGWVDGFYRSTIYNACDALKKTGVFSINIFEKIPKIKEITKMFLADKGWYVYKTDKYMLRTMPGMTKLEDGEYISRDVSLGAYEPIWYAKHYTQLWEKDSEEYKKAEKRVKC